MDWKDGTWKLDYFNSQNKTIENRRKQKLLRKEKKKKKARNGMVSNTQSKPKLEKYWEIIVEWILQTDLQVGRRECRTDNMSMPDPFIAFNHNQTITKHGLSVMFKHRRLPPALPQHSCRHSLQEFRVCNVQKWLCSQPVYKHLPCNTKFHYMSPHCTSNNLKKTRKRERKKKSRLTIRLRPARKVRKNS